MDIRAQAPGGFGNWSSFILAEFERNLPGKAGFAVDEAAEMVAYIKDFVTVIEPSRQISVIQEKGSDNRILECAVEAKADVLVTGNMRHIRRLQLQALGEAQRGVSPLDETLLFETQSG